MNLIKNSLTEYKDALDLLDKYDYQSLEKTKGNKSIYIMDYKDSREIIDSLEFNERSNVFGVEKENGKLEGILKSIEQTAFNKEVYDSVEEKAANLLYFLVKDHPFVDGCKRIAASIFIEYLYRNNILIKDDKLVLSNSTIVFMVLLIAESRAEEKETIIKLIMNALKLEK